jgi:hypothetical protein
MPLFSHVKAWMPTSVGMTNGAVRRVDIDGRWYKLAPL